MLPPAAQLDAAVTRYDDGVEKIFGQVDFTTSATGDKSCGGNIDVAPATALEQYTDSGKGREELQEAVRNLAKHMEELPSQDTEDLESPVCVGANTELENAILELCNCQEPICRSAFLMLAVVESDLRVTKRGIRVLSEASKPERGVESYEQTPHRDSEAKNLPAKATTAPDSKRALLASAAEQAELSQLRAELARLQTFEGQATALEKENQELGRSLKGMKYEVTQGQKAMKQSRIKDLRDSLHLANKKNDELSLTISHLKRELAETQNASVGAGATPDLPQLDIGVLKPFGLSSQDFETESARLLRHLGDNITDVVDRSRGITDRNGMGWSAYERLRVS